ncbi:ACP S-malonyltransferase [Rubricoccus marinus]|uniref:Malonyl CoA-acyl carrier protein transacylase n=1 Tax=Rubricoccus marinus TaxID=716817 RepID=A0A259U2P0_9BACT|nr:ACP S-malonyltransferase [Rubricoccus marinus]OZC04206.1 [acyl-carrier-protein] S-malonyltransferase [Rubricoccus marinus]
MTAFLFPGQGSQFAGMAADLAERFPESREVIERADAALGFSLSEAMFDTGETAAETLKRTEITQPALYVHSLAAHAALAARGLSCDMAAGHSLGEWSALAAVGAVGFEDGLLAVRRRAELMGQAGDVRPGTMAAVLGMDAADLERVCAEASGAGEGDVVAANYNDPGQIVISGDREAVERAGAMAQEAGARRVIPLPVSGAFHSPLMEFAREGLAATLETLDLSAPSVPVVLNVTAEPTTDPEVIRQRLLEQLTAPVRWAQTMEAMGAAGVTRFVEVGAGKVLAGLAKRSLGRQTETATAGTADEIEALAV